MIAANTACLWLDDQPQDAPTVYAVTVANRRVQAVQHAPDGDPGGRAGQVLTLHLDVPGIPCLGRNGGRAFGHSGAFSIQMATDDQTRTDRLRHGLVDNSGQSGASGWCKNRWGISWQITPRLQIQAQSDPDPGVARRAFHAMMDMGKIDIASIAAAIARRQ